MDFSLITARKKQEGIVFSRIYTSFCSHGEGVPFDHYPYCNGPHCTAHHNPRLLLYPGPHCTWTPSPSSPSGHGISLYLDLPASDIWLPSLQTRSNLLISGPPPLPQHCLHLVDIEASGASSQYASYWNVLLA